MPFPEPFVFYDLSSMICIDAIEAIASIGESKNISYKDLTQTLIKIQSTKIGGKWEVPVIKCRTNAVCTPNFKR